tara:strand:- start:175 stop:348 length:174 start_codon:yes stop_codon:yes gene_type:complete
MPNTTTNTYNRDAKRNVLHFLTHISEKNYAKANKYLRNALETKLKGRIKGTASKLGF